MSTLTQTPMTQTRKPRIKSKRAKSRDVSKNKNVTEARSYRIAKLNSATETQTPSTTLRDTFIALPEDVREQSVTDLNQMLVDTIMLRDLYKKFHWQLSGATFYQLHLMFDEHYRAQAELVDMIAERIQLLGGVAYATAFDVAENTRLDRAPIGREDPSVQMTRLLEAHEMILDFARSAAKTASKSDDVRTEDIFVSELIRINERQTWFVAEHSVPAQLQGNVEFEDAA